jgi:tripartite-type tricarboxylate transporter receptor subunit TctC
VQPALTIAPAMTKMPYDVQRDFLPVTVVGTNPFVLVVNKDVPVNSLSEFVAWVKSHPAKLSYAESSAGSLTHLSWRCSSSAPDWK